jgi:hypothetical protein
MALQGTLKDFGIADIFQLIGQQQKVGVLHLTEGEQEVHVAFKDGNVVRAESATRKKRELLGDMLVRAGLIAPRQLEEALEEQKRTLKRLGDILVASGAVTREALRETTQLQTGETLYKLFAWKSGHYEFEATEVEFDPESITPIRSESVLMEGFRRVDEWPAIRKRISSTAMTFERLRPIAEGVGTADEEDRALDEAFGEGRRAGRGEKLGDRGTVGENERQAYRLADPGRDVQFIVDRSRLGEFEACKALFNLTTLGYLRPVHAPFQAGADPGAAPRRSAAGVLSALAGQVAMAAVLLAAAAVVLTRVDLGALGRRARGEGTSGDPAVARALGRSQRSRIESALSAFAAVHGAAPASLEELVAQGMLTESDLRYPWREGYYYRRTGEATYVLLPPLR